MRNPIENSALRQAFVVFAQLFDVIGQVSILIMNLKCNAFISQQETFFFSLTWQNSVTTHIFSENMKLSRSFKMYWWFKLERILSSRIISFNSFMLWAANLIIFKHCLEWKTQNRKKYKQNAINSVMEITFHHCFSYQKPKSTNWPIEHSGDSRWDIYSKSVPFLFFHELFRYSF